MVDISDIKQLQLFQEELFAYISGDIHEGGHEDVLRRMLRDYDAVKAAWETLVQEQRGQGGVSESADAPDALLLIKQRLTETRQAEEAANAVPLLMKYTLAAPSAGSPKGRGSDGGIVGITKEALKARGRAEEEARFREESKPLRDRLTQVQAESEAAMAQIEDRYGRAVAERGTEQTTQAEGGETAERGKTKSEPKLTKDTTDDTLQKGQGGRQFQSEKIFAKHYGKHSKEFGEISVEEYLRRANMLADSLLSDDVVELTRSDGSVARYRFSTNEFVVINADGTLRTYFRPELGGRYWERELDRNN